MKEAVLSYLQRGKVPEETEQKTEANDLDMVCLRWKFMLLQATSPTDSALDFKKRKRMN